MKKYKDFKIGEKIIHRNTKTILESDNSLFCLLTMNPHPVHLNKRYAKKAHHGQILVIGTLVFSLAVGLTVPEISFYAIATVRYKNIKHINPVFIGDTIRVESEIMDKILGNTGRGYIEIESFVYIDEYHVSKSKSVMSFRREILVYE